MASSFSDYKVALKMRDIFKKIAVDTINSERPKYRYGTVQSIDRVNRKCTVSFNNASPVTVSMGSIQPKSTGQIVRVGGIGSDRFVEDVMGDALTVDPVKPGSLIRWTGDIADIPDGYFLADGREVSRTTYANLFAEIGTKYGAGNGTTTFNLPKKLYGRYGAYLINGPEIGPKFQGYASGGRTNTVNWEQPVAFKDEEGFVSLYGLLFVVTAASAGDLLFTLPPGYRPSKSIIFPAQTASTVTSVTVSPDGRVVARGSIAASTHVGISNIRFFAAGEAKYKEQITNFGSGYSQWNDSTYGVLEVERDSYGRCFVSGLLGGTWSSGTTAFTLPSTNGMYAVDVPTQQHLFCITSAGATGFNYLPSRELRTRTASFGSWASIAFTFVDTLHTMEKLYPTPLNGAAYSSAYDLTLHRTPTGFICTNGLFKPTATTPISILGLGPLTSPFISQIWAGLQSAEAFYRLESHPANYGGSHSVNQNTGASTTWESVDSMCWATQYHADLLAGTNELPWIIKV